MEQKPGQAINFIAVLLTLVVLCVGGYFAYDHAKSVQHADEQCTLYGC